MSHQWETHPEHGSALVRVHWAGVLCYCEEKLSHGGGAESSVPAPDGEGTLSWHPPGIPGVSEQPTHVGRGHCASLRGRAGASSPCGKFESRRLKILIRKYKPRIKIYIPLTYPFSKRNRHSLTFGMSSLSVRENNSLLRRPEPGLCRRKPAGSGTLHTALCERTPGPLHPRHHRQRCILLCYILSGDHGGSLQSLSASLPRRPRCTRLHAPRPAQWPVP